MTDRPEPGSLTKAEMRWLDRPQDDRPRQSASHLIRKATERHQTSAVTVAAALINATVAVPPQQRGRALGTPRGTDVPDPALSQIEATIHAVDRGTSRLGHLLDDCLLCPSDGGHNDDSTVTLAGLAGHDWTEIADHCVGISATSPHAVEQACRKAAQAHAWGATKVLEDWMQARRDGAEPDVLDRWAHQVNRLSLQMSSLADSLGQWRPGTLVRLCACGCGAHAPSGRRVTAACEIRDRRARKQAG